VGHDHFDPKGWARLPAALAADDLEGEVAAAYLATELSREVHAADDVGQARRRLLEFFFSQHCAAADVHATGLSNGPTEGVNLLIEVVRRIGHGFRNLDNYRLRLVLRCGVT
jgi:transposase